MIDLVGKRYLWYLISAIAIVPGVISLIFNGVDQGIDFTGGTSWELEMAQPAKTEDIRAILDEHGFTDSVVQISDETTVLIRMKELTEGSETKQAIEVDFRERYGEFRELQINTVGPTVGQEIRNRAVFAIVLASIGVLLYIAYAFRKTHAPLRYGTCAIIAMLHDVLFVLGLFSILGWVANVEVDALFVTAILTIMGFSVHDTIAVFDRIREN
ncbi:MAG: protein translocase subunit SecF, partial [Vicinamibacterales bacterium]